jgi:cytochrome c556
MARLTKIMIVFFIFALASFSTLLANENILKRQNSMLIVKNSMKILGPAAMGQSEFDKALIKKTLGDLLSAIKSYKDYFPEDSKEGNNTSADSSIWENKEDFNGLVDSFISSVEISYNNEWQTSDEFKSDFMSISNNCRSCHKKYRR